MESRINIPITGPLYPPTRAEIARAIPPLHGELAKLISFPEQQLLDDLLAPISREFGIPPQNPDLGMLEMPAVVGYLNRSWLKPIEGQANLLRAIIRKTMTTDREDAVKFPFGVKIGGAAIVTGVDVVKMGQFVLTFARNLNNMQTHQIVLDIAQIREEATLLRRYGSGGFSVSTIKSAIKEGVTIKMESLVRILTAFPGLFRGEGLTAFDPDCYELAHLLQGHPLIEWLNERVKFYYDVANQSLNELRPMYPRLNRIMEQSIDSENTLLEAKEIIAKAVSQATTASAQAQGAITAWAALLGTLNNDNYAELIDRAVEASRASREAGRATRLAENMKTAAYPWSAAAVGSGQLARTAQEITSLAEQAVMITYLGTILGAVSAMRAIAGMVRCIVSARRDVIAGAAADTFVRFENLLQAMDIRFAQLSDGSKKDV